MCIRDSPDAGPWPGRIAGRMPELGHHRPLSDERRFALGCRHAYRAGSHVASGHENPGRRLDWRRPGRRLARGRGVDVGCVRSRAARGCCGPFRGGVVLGGRCARCHHPRLLGRGARAPDHRCGRRRHHPGRHRPGSTTTPEVGRPVRSTGPTGYICPGYGRRTRSSSSAVIGRPVRLRLSCSAPAMSSSRSRRRGPMRRDDCRVNQRSNVLDSGITLHMTLAGSGGARRLSSPRADRPCFESPDGPPVAVEEAASRNVDVFTPCGVRAVGDQSGRIGSVSSGGS